MYWLTIIARVWEIASANQDLLMEAVVQPIRLRF
jgi:hypothetical protein